MPLEFAPDGGEGLIGRGHHLFEALEVLGLFALGGDVQRIGRPDTGHDVFALGVREPLAEELVFAGGRVPRERDARGGVAPHVAEDHRPDVRRGAPLVGDAFDAAVRDGPPAVPRLEDRADGAPELLLGIVRERLADNLPDLLAELAAEGFELLGREVRVGLRAA